MTLSLPMLRTAAHRITFLLTTTVFFMVLTSHSQANTAVAEAPVIYSAQQVQADFDELYQTMSSAHANLFHTLSRAEYEAAYKATRDGFTAPMSHFDVERAFQQFVALGKVAHARINFPAERFSQFRSSGGKTLPIYFRWRDHRWFVSENYSNSSALTESTEVLALNGISMDAWFERLKKHISADTDELAATLLELQFQQYLWLELGEINEFTLTIQQANLVRDVTVPALNKQQLLSAVEATASTSNSGELRDAKMLSNAIAYLKPGPFYNAEDPQSVWDTAAFHQFIDQAFESFITAGADTLIIDLRQNPGGDNSFSDHLIAWFADKPFSFASTFTVRSSAAAAASNQARLATIKNQKDNPSFWLREQYEATPFGQSFNYSIPETQPRKGKKFNGKVICLVNRHSYSNAVSVAAIVQDYGFGTVAGETTADFATTYGSMETFSLTHTGIQVGFPKALIVRPSGDTTLGPVIPSWPLLPDGAETSNADSDPQLDKLVNRLIGQAK